MRRFFRSTSFAWIHDNLGYKSGGALDAHFGLGKATSADVTVTLLDGKTKTITTLAANAATTLDLQHPRTVAP